MYNTCISQSGCTVLVKLRYNIVIRKCLSWLTTIFRLYMRYALGNSTWKAKMLNRWSQPTHCRTRHKALCLPHIHTCIYYIHTHTMYHQPTCKCTDHNYAVMWIIYTSSAWISSRAYRPPRGGGDKLLGVYKPLISYTVMGYGCTNPSPPLPPTNK
jgi:hypothetical protein